MVLPRLSGVLLFATCIQALLPNNSSSDLLVFASSRVVLSGSVSEATLVVNTTTGKIISVDNSVRSPSEFPPGTAYTDYSPKLLLPGLLDAHVHLNEPGRTEWEGFWTGSRAAASGGVTTLIDMPLNSLPPTTTVENLMTKVKAADGQCWVDVGFHGGLIPNNTQHLKSLVDAGVRSFKGFLIESGVDEFPAIGPNDIEAAMHALAGSPTTVMFHAEMVPPNVTLVGSGAPYTGPLTSYQTYLDSRPPTLETYAISQILSKAHIAPDLDLHIVHLSAAEGIPMLREARDRGIQITAETCFHYLSLASEEVPEGDTRYKSAPPARDLSNQALLWEELSRENGDGVIKTVVSDHSPCTPDLKLIPESLPVAPHSHQGEDGDFFSAWGGVSSLGLGLSILWTQADSRGITIEDIVRWTSTNTARQVGLEQEKGDLGVGFDADVVVFDDTAFFEVNTDTMFFRNEVSPFEGKTLKGAVDETWLRGRKIFDRTTGFDEEQGPVGRTILEPRRRKAVRMV
ncbi:Allantoinase [Colletotrichum fructicola]|uniref:allantoinase n=1 Tax=Colletotrichum fructicola (strain Nara gc5) TaxID=1213859 RepID=L2FX79_COLFN|nr:Allantoinase [Colletotrichum fructicola]KAF4483071.1 Allantoinase [Colletotrichum fructicola Nara gc5]KAI8289122.1 Allantoinase [Colletotrichum sp. SAR11_57]KAE9568376.1 Allantoinase [Colletotrichum fructicola]KAF4430656.1 Allantoinase [Colletotrichum fructicola]KAF4884370.1 Allantoinase [Colletotrichum fructicola]